MLSYLLNDTGNVLLVLLRVVAFIGVSPLLSMRVWPNWAKLGLAVFVSFNVLGSVTAPTPDPIAHPGEFVLLALKETMVGLLIGFAATLVFAALSIAGQAFDLQIGLSSAQLFDPVGAQSTGLTNSFLSLLFTLYFVGINGLDGLLLVIMKSYHYVPLGQFGVGMEDWNVLVRLLGVCMVLGLQLGAPLMVALLLTDVTFALLSRAVPQMNVYIVGQPAKLFVGLTVFAAVMPGVVWMFGNLFQTLFTSLNTLLQWLGG